LPDIDALVEEGLLDPRESICPWCHLVFWAPAGSVFNVLSRTHDKVRVCPDCTEASRV